MQSRNIEIEEEEYEDDGRNITQDIIFEAEENKQIIRKPVYEEYKYGKKVLRREVQVPSAKDYMGIGFDPVIIIGKDYKKHYRIIIDKNLEDSRDYYSKPPFDSLKITRGSQVTSKKKFDEPISADSSKLYAGKIKVQINICTEQDEIEYLAQKK